jgi:hypothetical protein
VQLVPSPVKPLLQVQLNDPTVSVQAALLSQVFNSESAHSSIFVQLFPFPVKPLLQVQLNDSTVSVQAALLSQVFNSESAHSSIFSNSAR